MNSVAGLWCILLFVNGIELGANGRRRNKHSFRGRNTGSCETYHGKICSAHLAGQKVFIKRRLADVESKVRTIISILNRHVTARCRKYVLPTLCNYSIPPCDKRSKKPKPKRFCQDDCYVLQRDVCKLEFQYAKERFPRMLPDCSILPAQGSPDYKTCIRVTMKAVTFSARVENITMFEGHAVTLKCRLSTKKVHFNITWLKNSLPIGSRYKTRNFRWGSRLKIRRSRVDDAGKFECVVQAMGSQVKAVGWLRIMGVNALRPTGRRGGQTRLPGIEIPTRKSPMTRNNKGDKGTKGPRRRYPRCEPYRGKTCADFIGGELIFCNNRHHQDDIESKLRGPLTAIRASPSMSPKCRKYGIPALCYHIFHTCDPQTTEPMARLCKNDCFALYEDVCAVELSLAKTDPLIRDLLPNCSILPTFGSHDYAFCTPLMIPGYTKQLPEDGGTTQLMRYIVHLNSSKEQHCYNESGIYYVGRHNVTESGVHCKPWNSHDSVFNLSHNYCRNPRGQRKAPWCYVDKNRYEYCVLPKCAEGLSKRAVIEAPSILPVGRTIYVISAIMAVLIVAFVSIIVYLKVQHRRSTLPNRDRSSSGSISKSTQSTMQQPSSDFKQSMTDVKSCVFHEIDESNQGKVKFLENLGEGGFSKVCKAALMANEQDVSDVRLAIKRLKTNVPSQVVDNFKNEITVLTCLQDLNILSLVGVSAGEEPLFMVFEYYDDMDLHRFLNLHIPSHLTPTSEDDPDEILLLDFALQVASGMDFLVENNFVHRDVAARNCFVTEDNIVKISNLGIGSCKYPADYSWVHGSSLLPVRWMAPEALNSLQFTHRSDVWSYGVVMWEIYSYGRQPYAECTNQEAIENIRNLQILTCPDGCPARMYALMRECFEESSWDRPQFTDICSRLRAWAGDSIGENH